MLFAETGVYPPTGTPAGDKSMAAVKHKCNCMSASMTTSCLLQKVIAWIHIHPNKFQSPFTTEVMEKNGG